MRTVLCHGSDDVGFQRHPEQRWREVADVLEELTRPGILAQR